MTVSAIKFETTNSAPERLARAARALAVIIISILITAVGLVAIGSGSGVIPLPYEMFVLAERVPIVFRAHMIAGALALLVIPLIIAARHQPAMHRMLGRLGGGFVVLAGLTSFPVAIMSESSFVARAGFFVQGVVWLILLARGIAAIRAGDRRRHAHLMLAMASVTSGAVWFRVITGLAIYWQLPFAAIYAAAAWLGWLIPLTLVTAWPRVTDALLVRHPRPSPAAS